MDLDPKIVWRQLGHAGWHFVTLPSGTFKKVKDFVGSDCGPWGSVSIEALLGNAKLKTSLFPDRKIGSYVLPLKASVRRKEKIAEELWLNVPVLFDAVTLLISQCARCRF